MPPRSRPEFAAASLLSGAAGFADALGYVASGVFAANMTGNTVLGAMALAQGRPGIAAERFGTLLVFFAGAMLARVVLHWKDARVSWALAAEGAILLAASAIGIGSFAGLQLVAMAMGVQAAAMTRFAGAQVSTVVITSTLARIAETVVDRGTRLVGTSPAAAQHDVRLLGSTWLCYGLGAAGAVGFLALAPGVPHALAVPALAVLAVAGLMRTPGRGT